jgi:hypothetical protein
MIAGIDGQWVLAGIGLITLLGSIVGLYVKHSRQIERTQTEIGEIKHWLSDIEARSKEDRDSLRLLTSKVINGARYKP